MEKTLVGQHSETRTLLRDLVDSRKCLLEYRAYPKWENLMSYAGEKTHWLLEQVLAPGEPEGVVRKACHQFAGGWERSEASRGPVKLSNTDLSLAVTGVTMVTEGWYYKLVTIPHPPLPLSPREVATDYHLADTWVKPYVEWAKALGRCLDSFGNGSLDSVVKCLDRERPRLGTTKDELDKIAEVVAGRTSLGSAKLSASKWNRLVLKARKVAAKFAKLAVEEIQFRLRYLDASLSECVNPVPGLSGC